MLLLLHGVLLVLVVASRCGRSVSDDRSRLRRDWAHGAAVAASAAIAAMTSVTSVSMTVSMSVMTDRLRLFRRFIPHNPKSRFEKKNAEREKLLEAVYNSVSLKKLIIKRKQVGKGKLAPP